jgi:hypothetical protein
MKRDIKFRAWDGEKMIFRGLHDRNWYTDEKSGKAVKGTHPSDTHFLTVMQFTGLHDKNGKGIYEGDKCKTYQIGIGNLIQVVSFDNGSFILQHEYQIPTELRGFKTDFIEVIGNTHETRIN